MNLKLILKNINRKENEVYNKSNHVIKELL